MREIVLLGPRGVRLRTWVPQTSHEHRRGLLDREELGEDEAMLFEHTRSVHTFGMRFEIAAALLDQHLSVRDVLPMRRGRLLRPRRGVRHVLECRVDAGLRPGDRLERDGRYTSRRCPRRRRAPIV